MGGGGGPAQAVLAEVSNRLGWTELSIWEETACRGNEHGAKGGCGRGGTMGPTNEEDHTCLGWAELSIWSAVAEWRALLTSWRHRRRAAPRVSSDIWPRMLCRKARASLPQAPRVSRTNAVRAGPGYRVCLARSLRPMACCDPEEASSCAESTQETSRWMLRF